jgi:hypothetical protein
MPSPLMNLKAGVATDADIKREIVVLADDGAITATTSCTVMLTKGSAAAVTIADPTAAMNGVEITIMSMSAAAHTVTRGTTGFNAAGGSGDVATFGAAKGNSFTIIAYNTVWYVKNLTGVTLG